MQINLQHTIIPSYGTSTILRVKPVMQWYLFPEARPLPEDNGERFFGEYWLEEIQRRWKFNSSPLNDRCQCNKCGGGSAPLPHFQEYPAIEEINEEPVIPEEIELPMPSPTAATAASAAVAAIAYIQLLLLMLLMLLMPLLLLLHRRQERDRLIMEIPIV